MMDAFDPVSSVAPIPTVTPIKPIFEHSGATGERTLWYPIRVPLSPHPTDLDQGCLCHNDHLFPGILRGQYSDPQRLPASSF